MSTIRQLAIKLVAGEPVKSTPAKIRIPRSSLHFSRLLGAELGSDGYHHNEGAAKYDLLALDAIPRDVKSGSTLTDVSGRHVADTESLLKDRITELVLPESKTYQSYNGFRYTPSAKQLCAIRESNSTDHILNPTGGNVCGKCGYDKYCKCPKPVWAGGTPVARIIPVPIVQSVGNGGIWLRGTKLFAILP